MQPESLRDPAAQAALRALAPDLLIVVAYGLILPTAVLETPRHGCWNVHASLLPRWRGAAPLQRAIEAGDAENGVRSAERRGGKECVSTCRYYWYSYYSKKKKKRKKT